METAKKMSDQKAEKIAAGLAPILIRLDDALAGVGMGDAVLALSFMIHHALSTLDQQGRTRALTSVVQLIDPDTPSVFKQ